jgi:hypothetical protein
MRATPCLKEDNEIGSKQKGHHGSIGSEIDDDLFLVAHADTLLPKLPIGELTTGFKP